MGWKNVLFFIAALAFWMLLFGLRSGVLPTYVSAPVTRQHERRAFRVAAFVYAFVALAALSAFLFL